MLVYYTVTSFTNVLNDMLYINHLLTVVVKFSHYTFITCVCGWTGLLAYQCMYSSQAVTAEGLFRSALDGFKKYPVVLKNDIRFVGEVFIYLVIYFADIEENVRKSLDY